MHITFTTDRKYNGEIQKITAEYDREGKTIYFVDHTRHVHGEFEYLHYNNVDGFTTKELAKRVMARLDQGAFRRIPAKSAPKQIMSDPILEFNKM